MKTFKQINYEQIFQSFIDHLNTFKLIRSDRNWLVLQSITVAKLAVVENLAQIQKFLKIGKAFYNF